MLTLLFSQVMSNVGATVMMVPIAISVAVATGGNPSAYALIVAVSSSNTFLLSSGHPALMMVDRPRWLPRQGFPARGCAAYCC